MSCPIRCYYAVIFIFVFSMGMFLAACGPSAPAAQPVVSGGQAQPVTLKLAVLPIIDALPMYVAQKEGLFEKHGVQVEFVPVASAAERDQVIAAGQADGMINEALSTAFYNRDKVQVQIVRFARAATREWPLFSILASGKSGIQAVDDLKGVEIGISQGTVIEYLSDRLLQAEGLSPQEIQFIAVPKIPDRLNLLGTGELKAAMLPEPAASLALKGGARLILDDTRHPEYSYSTITFRKPVIDQQPQAIRGFLAAIEEATALINTDPARYGGLLVEQKVVPPDLAGKFNTPTFVTAGVPSQAQWDDVIAWAKSRGLLDAAVSYADSVNAGFLP